MQTSQTAELALGVFDGRLLIWCEHLNRLLDYLNVMAIVCCDRFVECHAIVMRWHDYALSSGSLMSRPLFVLLDEFIFI